MDNLAQSQSFPQPLPTVGFNPTQNIVQPTVETAPQANSKIKLIIFAVATIFLVIVSTGVFLFIKMRTKATSAQKESSAQLTTADKPNVSQAQDNQNVLNKSIPPVNVSPTPAPDQPANLYTNQTLGFSIKGPDNWEKVESSQGILVMFRDSQKQLGANEVEFYSNLSVVIEPLAPNVSLDQYAKAGNAQRALVAQDYVLLGSTRDNLGGQPAYIDDYTATIGSINMRQRQVYAIKSNNAYIITFSTLPQGWESYLPIFDQARSSFTFTGTVSGVKTNSGIVLGVEGGF